jgi:NaMN:DMB phosphoribosyltransferase
MATSFVTGNKSSAQPALTFSHLLTQILVKVYAQDATTIGLWGNVTGIAVAGRQPTCTLTLPAPGATGVVTSAFSGSVTDLPLTKSDGTAAPSLTVTATTQTAAQTFGYCMFAPVNSALTLKVTTAKGGTKEVAVPSNNFEKGKAYTIAVLLKSSSLAATANIGTWVDGTSGGPISSELQ